MRLKESREADRLLDLIKMDNMRLRQIAEDESRPKEVREAAAEELGKRCSTATEKLNGRRHKK